MEEAHGLTNEVIQSIIWEAVNLAIFLTILFVVYKKSFKNLFAERRAHFLAAAEKSQQTQRQAESEQKEIEVKLHRLESTASESLERARTEAAELKKQMVLDAENTSRHLHEEASATAKVELEKARNQIRTRIIELSFNLAKSDIGPRVSSDDHIRLQGEFLSNIQAVQR